MQPKTRPYRRNWLWRLSGVKQKNEVGYHISQLWKSLLTVSRALIPLRLIEVQEPVASFKPCPAPNSVANLKRSTAKLRGALHTLPDATVTPAKPLLSGKPGSVRPEAVGIKRHRITRDDVKQFLENPL